MIILDIIITMNNIKNLKDLKNNKITKTILSILSKLLHAYLTNFVKGRSTIRAYHRFIVRLEIQWQIQNK